MNIPWVLPWGAGEGQRDVHKCRQQVSQGSSGQVQGNRALLQGRPALAHAPVHDLRAAAACCPPQPWEPASQAVPGKRCTPLPLALGTPQQCSEGFLSNTQTQNFRWQSFPSLKLQWAFDCLILPQPLQGREKHGTEQEPRGQERLPCTSQASQWAPTQSTRHL